MERVVKVARDQKEAARWDILQQTRMTPEERLAAALELRRRVYGDSCPDVRAAELNK